MKGILFKPWKIKAIADSPLDRLWQTRRVMQNQPLEMDKVYYKDFKKDFGGRNPRYQVGEIVYIKEAWLENVPGCLGGISYKLDHLDPKGDGPANPMKWRFPKMMSEKYARYHITITGVRVERTMDISEEDCFAEGIILLDWQSTAYHWDKNSYKGFSTPEHAYFALYDSINGKDAHKTNWDWVYSFKRTED